jgi:hypothetical protein
MLYFLALTVLRLKQFATIVQINNERLPQAVLAATVTVRKKKRLAKKPYIGSDADKKQDKKTMKGMTPAQKAKFKKEDAKMDKDKTLTKKADTKKDNALAKKIKGKK